MEFKICYIEILFLVLLGFGTWEENWFQLLSLSGFPQGKDSITARSSSCFAQEKHKTND